MSSFYALFGRSIALLVLVLQGACAQLPEHVDRPVSTALSSPNGTALEALVQQRRKADGARFESGFLLLAGPPAAYGSRLALIEGAQKTLDLQYYAIHADASTGRLVRGLRAAAERGVRVRILLDDLHSTGRDALVLGLAFVPNIEMRLFNPLAGARGSSFARALNSIGDASRIQQRMHNKLFLADNVLGVTGGRNLGDAYFGNALKGNYIDVDILAAGPIVRDLSRSFDSYWNNERAYPVQSLVKRSELEAIRERAQQADRELADESARAQNSPPPATPEAEPKPGAAPTPAQLARAWDEKPMDLQTARFVWAPAVMLADQPGKIPADKGAGTTRAPGLVVSQPGDAASSSRRAAALETSSDLAAGSDTVVEGLLQLIGQARTDLLIISPYFVPGPDMKQAFAAARSRGVRIRVLTNSLSSNDAPVAHVGYSRHREDLLRMGVELYELRSEQASVGNAFGSSGSGGSLGESRSMLHSKVLVMDGRLLVVGSMNLDLRSQLQNTEIALLVRSAELSRAASAQIERGMREGSWRVELNDGSLVWRAPEGSGLKDTSTEPDASLTLRLLLRLFGPLAPDQLL
ncbi:phosphatidylserine/phosphatidylglycerophosphate/cardiolipin synthase-like enzyme [Variovorax paradoxus]|uniref:Phosphatidylserine/phosphatidylglycerophosphate/ cardiolipin synthase-like enzyme n=1 Tax=Variovorax paradoxus TaxID=34073 RepID=A0AAE3XZ93_VARPD|nr:MULTISPECIES: phospholipase D family protein [Variovorax]MBD9668146.1 phospholipase D family protein [Variovorax sp. VRV01]MDP9966757.1 phosphatidylserine/phosphatidylglycerophosphate/cardiolipin synthase-like enzyme [Variovorax paradoxus]MDR6426807.1 phosphatidylserine/phosphatidylglycerophosphate/cardiolipin synthase-like enzyme [Variovorax paradoxus]